MIFDGKVPKTRSGGIAPGVYKRLRTNLDRFDKSWEFCQCRFIQCVLNSSLLILNQLYQVLQPRHGLGWLEKAVYEALIWFQEDDKADDDKADDKKRLILL